MHIPYKGSAPGVADLASGHIPMMTPNITPQVLSLHRSKRVRILSVNGDEPLKAAPEIPVSSSTVPNMIAQLFSGLFAPAGTPAAIVERVSQATRKALADASFQKTLIQSGFEPVLDSGPQKARAFINKERDRFLPVIEAVGLKTT